MAEQLALAERVDPWVEARAKQPGAKLIRVINVRLEEQRFIPTDESQWPDGATIVVPSVADGYGRSATEIEAIIAEYDRRWPHDKPGDPAA